MSYETVVEQVKTIPEEYLAEVSDYLNYVQYKIKFAKAKQSDDSIKSKINSFMEQNPNAFDEFEPVKN